MDHAELLEQLADIHLPEAVGFWPLAPGWWLLGLLLLAGLYLGGRALLANWRRRRYCAEALAVLESIREEFAAAGAAALEAATLRYVNACNALLRRVALAHFPGAPASLGGDQWIAFLRGNGDCRKLDEPLAEALRRGRFQRTIAVDAVDAEALHGFCEQWIRSVYLRRGIPASENRAGDQRARTGRNRTETG